MLLYAFLLPKSTLNANLTTTNRFFTNDDWQRGRFENIESDVRFEIESNHEASQVPTIGPSLAHSREEEVELLVYRDVNLLFCEYAKNHFSLLLVGSVALLVARRTNDRKIAGSRPTK